MVALPPQVATGQVIASSWGNQVVAMQDELTPRLNINGNTNEKFRIHAASGIVATDANGRFTMYRAGFTGQPVTFVGYHGTFAVGVNIVSEYVDRVECIAVWLSNATAVANTHIAVQFITVGQYVGTVDPLPATVAPGQPIEAAWGNSVVSKLDAITPKYNFEGGASKPGRMQILAGSGLVTTDINGAFAVQTLPGFVNKGVAWCSLYTLPYGWFVNVYRQTETHFEGVLCSAAPGNGYVGNSTVGVQYAAFGYYA